MRTSVRLHSWLVTSLLFVAVAPAAAATNVSGAISKNTTWSVSGSPYIVTGTVTVNANKTLTVAAGVTVKFNAATSLTVLGTLSAVGTASSPILFTSSAAPPAPGNWGSINFNPGSSNCRISYATVEYGGSGGGAGINAYAGTPTLDHVTIRNHSGNGLLSTGYTTTTTVTFSTITANGGVGIYLDGSGGINVSNTSLTNNSSWAMSANPTTRVLGLTNMAVTGNSGGTRDAIGYRAGAISGADTWPSGMVWVIETGNITVSSSGALTIAAGTTVKLGATSGIDVSGVLTAVGTASSPITVTSNASSPSPGSWGCITFNTGSSASRLSYASLLYGGNTNTCYTNAWNAGNSAMVRVYAGTPAFDHLTVSNSGSSGIYVSGATTTPTLSLSTMSNNAVSGLYVETNGGISVSDTALTGNTSWAIYTTAGTRILSLTNMTVSGNNGGAKDAIGHGGGSTTLSETWRAGMVWVVTVSYDTSQALTVAAGTTVKVAASMAVSAATLSAVGTAASPIVFTSTLASPAPGSWRYLSSSSTAQLSYVSVSYAGNAGGGSAALSAGGSSTLDHVTVASSSWDGLEIRTGADTAVSFSTITSNGNAGIRARGKVNLSNTTITNNTSWAVIAENSSQVNGLTNMTVSGNGGSSSKNAIERLAGNITTAETWASGMTWVLDTGWVTVTSSGLLTIQPGTTIKVSGGTIWVSGTLTAVGTQATPIVFTSAAASPAPGDWGGLHFDTGSSASRLSYASVSHGFNGVFVGSSSPVLDHVIIASSQRQGLVVGDANPGPSISFATIMNNLQSGLYADTSIFPVKNSSFIANGPSGFVNGDMNSGIYNVTPSTAYPVTATGCYWGAASGPAGVGPGTGGSVSAKVFYEPWLIEAPTDVNYFTGLSVSNRTFDPALGVQSSISFTSSLVGNWTLTVRNSGGAVVRTFTGHGSTATSSWDGKNEIGTLQPNGIYTYQLAATADSGPVAARLTGFMIIDSSVQPTITNLALTPAMFSPNGDGVQDTALLTATTNYDTASWTVTVRNGANTVVRAASGGGTAISYVWDGRDGSGALQPDGGYTETVTVTVGSVSTSSAPSGVTIDRTFPSVAILSPTAAATLSNVYQNGATVIAIRGSASDSNFQSWMLEWGVGSSPANWAQMIGYGYQPFTNQVLANWATEVQANGTYTLRLRAWDLAGNVSAALTTVTIGNFSADLSGREFNPSIGQLETYTSTVPFALTETLVIKNAAGQVVRNLVNVSRPAGVYTDNWNGRNDGGSLLPDGPYFYFITLTAGSSTMTWDLTNVFYGDPPAFADNLNIAPFDPFNNSPMTFIFSPGPSKLRIGVGPDHQNDVTCQPPQVCLMWGYHEGGPIAVQWAGVDDTGAFRPEMSWLGVISEVNTFSRNAVIAYGTKPRVSNVRVSPVVFGPAVGSQTVTFDLATYLNQAVAVTVSFLNQSSLSTLRTIAVAQQAPGLVSVVWDGHADNGMLVAPGYYTITVTATDLLGQQARGQILTQVQY